MWDQRARLTTWHAAKCGWRPCVTKCGQCRCVCCCPCGLMDTVCRQLEKLGVWAVQVWPVQVWPTVRKARCGQCRCGQCRCGHRPSMCIFCGQQVERVSRMGRITVGVAWDNSSRCGQASVDYVRRLEAVSHRRRAGHQFVSICIFGLCTCSEHQRRSPGTIFYIDACFWKV